MIRQGALSGSSNTFCFSQPTLSSNACSYCLEIAVAIQDFELEYQDIPNYSILQLSGGELSGLRLNWA